jgi:hypothetical protein
VSCGSLERTCRIAFLVNRNTFQDGEYLHCFEYYGRERGMGLGGKTRVITVELSKREQTVETACYSHNDGHVPPLA